MGDMVGDLVCILEHANVSSAICVGYVWRARSTIYKTELTADIFQPRLGFFGLLRGC